MSLPPCQGRESLPSSGFILVPNRLDLPDLSPVEALLSGRQHFYIREADGVYDMLATSHMDKEDDKVLTLPAEGEDNNEGFSKSLHQRLGRGDVGIFFPGRVIARNGSPLYVRHASLKAISSLGATVVPLFVDHPRETALSIQDSNSLPEQAFAFAPPLDRESVTAANIQEKLLAAGEACFSQRPLFDGHLGRALLRGLKKHGKRAGLIDGLDGSTLRYDRVMAAAITLATELKTLTREPRIGIILPPGRAGLIANIAAVLANKTPVNINFTASKDAVESSFEQSGVDRFITADAFVRKLQRFPWPPNRKLIFLERLLPSLKSRMAKWFLLGKILPASFIAAHLGIPKKGGDKEAVLLFTSGSSGPPKGVPLSHRNALSNVNQFSTRLFLKSDDSILGSLPLFHSFGSTVTLWYPVIEGVPLVTYPSPLEVEKISDLIAKHEVTLHIATPTFLRSYLRRVEPKKLKSLRYLVTGAEKLPESLSEKFRERFNIELMEGYGLTETSPVTNFNLPNLPEDDKAPVIPSHRPGSVGQLVPGLAMRLTDPATDAPVPLNKSGIIWFKGSNVFNGYLELPEKTEEVIQDKWFRTGDIGRFDEDGFLFIEGRLSRFSKIGGEMVPHEGVEEYITKALDLDKEDERSVVVIGLPDEAKGEVLILLSTKFSDTPDQDLTSLRYQLREEGVPALWIPRKGVKVDEIPILASGKLDIAKCKELASEGADKS